MSASLVGSEMCIRDRLCSASERGLRIVVCPRIRDCHRIGRSTGISDYGLPVSYTHLTLPTICSV
eukprot:3166308-Alexandrium_andersonii.AAC.1